MMLNIVLKICLNMSRSTSFAAMRFALPISVSLYTYDTVPTTSPFAIGALSSSGIFIIGSTSAVISLPIGMSAAMS